MVKGTVNRNEEQNSGDRSQESGAVKNLKFKLKKFVLPKARG